MKRLTLIIAVIIAVFALCLCLIPCGILWLLGADYPYTRISEAFSDIVFKK